jgi:hypothetical protein
MDARVVETNMKRARNFDFDQMVAGLNADGEHLIFQTQDMLFFLIRTLQPEKKMHPRPFDMKVQIRPVG